ncbi:MAG: Fic family protein [Ilumatobacteraceae bacterium]
MDQNADPTVPVTPGHVTVYWRGGRPYSRVAAAMDDLVAFANRRDIAPLVHVAVAHAQFETIRPFPDGNGRTGRALVHAMLRHRGITRAVTVPISAGLLVDTGAYFDALGDYRAGHLEPIIRQMTDASFDALGNAQQMIDELDAVHDDWNSRIAARSDSSVWPLTRLLGEPPAVTSTLVADRLGVSIPAALNAIGRLEDAGIVVNAKGQERNRAWVAVDVIAVLDRFADRGGRRNLAWQLSRCVPGTDQLGGWNSWARIARASVLGLGGATDARYRR